MIVRIMGEGQYVLPEESFDRLNVHDREIEQAVTDNDQEALTNAVASLLEAVREWGSAVPDDLLADSELILPDRSVRLDEMRAWLADGAGYDGIIPG